MIQIHQVFHHDQQLPGKCVCVWGGGGGGGGVESIIILLTVTSNAKQGQIFIKNSPPDVGSSEFIMTTRDYHAASLVHSTRK